MIRPRHPSDLPRLVDILLTQRTGSGYPVSLPPDGPVGLIAREHEVNAWVAEIEGDVVGHISLCRAPDPVPTDMGEEVDQYLSAHACSPAELGIISALFLADSVRRRGLGRALLEHAMAACRAASLRACLDVVVLHTDALRLYERLGWERVGEIHPLWLPAGLGPVITMIYRDKPLRQQSAEDSI